MKNLIWIVLLLSACDPRNRGVHQTYFPTPPAPAHPVDPGPPPVLTATVSVPTLPATASIDVPGVRTATEDERISTVNGRLEDAYFGYDRSDLSAEALAALRRDAALLWGILADFPGLKVVVEGHCDERGSAEYNLALGDRRAARADQVLREYGVPGGAIEIVSYGKEAPQCLEASEGCWQKNRRAHISVARRPRTLP